MNHPDPIESILSRKNTEQSAPHEPVDITSGDIMSREDIDAIRAYVDECIAVDESIDFDLLMKAVYAQRVANRDKAGIYLDPIDDQHYVAQPEDLIGFMRPDQLMAPSRFMVLQSTMELTYYSTTFRVMQVA